MGCKWVTNTYWLGGILTRAHHNLRKGPEGEKWAATCSACLLLLPLQMRNIWHVLRLQPRTRTDIQIYTLSRYTHSRLLLWDSANRACVKQTFPIHHSVHEKPSTPTSYQTHRQLPNTTPVTIHQPKPTTIHQMKPTTNHRWTINMKSIEHRVKPFLKRPLRSTEPESHAHPVQFEFSPE